ncbi:Rv3654c family TadE-like protein [Streptomyces sp. NPDC006332]|uniref:Rv3654c family TadE-like protein n=1 Tax=Streptomyces sp. NPDC006332 TaxID=3155456 RepID=UPI0033B46BF2
MVTVLRAVGRGGGRDRGSATVWSVAAIAVLCVVVGVVLAMGQAVVARHRAAGGADLAALAAADHWADGGTAACARADRVARAQSARLVRCVLVGEISDVSAVSGRGPFAAEVRARAGPAEAEAESGQGQGQGPVSALPEPPAQPVPVHGPMPVPVFDPGPDRVPALAPPPPLPSAPPAPPAAAP